MIAEAAVQTGCRSVAFTYNDPVVWAEYAIDTARACRERGIHPVAVTAGYIEPKAGAEFYSWMDAANVDLKAFSEHFYHQLTFSHLQPVLDTLRWIKRETSVWLEITTLLIPEENDSPDEIARMCDWIAENLGVDVPLHFTAFHPDYRFLERPPTPPAHPGPGPAASPRSWPSPRLLGQRVRSVEPEHLLPRLWQARDRARLVRPG